MVEPQTSGKDMFIGLLNLFLGLCFASASLGFAPAFLRSDIGVVAAFFVFGISFVPFVATYTGLGLNHEDEGAEESKNRREMLSKRMPYWNPSFYACVIVSVGAMVFHASIHPFFVFMAAGSFLSAYWFLHVFPAAKEILKEPHQEPEPIPASRDGSP